jgi:orotate phosphoribosyltransferase
MSTARAELITLLTDRSLQTGTFTLASARTSSYYIDARRTTMSARGLDLVGRLGLTAIREAGWDAQLVGGLTLGADPVAYAVALTSRNAPPPIDAFTIRKAPKDHGAARLIEGCFTPGARVVVVEDVLTTGASALQAAEVLAREGARVLGVLAVVDRNEGGRDAVAQAGYELRALVAAEELGVRHDAAT